MGRFLQADTIVPEPGDPQSLNRYAYASNNPLGWTDPSGHAPAALAPIVDFSKIQVSISKLPELLKALALVPCSALGLVVDRDHNVIRGRTPEEQVSDVVGLVTPIGIVGGPTIAAGHGLTYLRHTAPAKFERLLSLGARNGEEASTILRQAGSDAVIRSTADRAGNQILLRSGNRDFGLHHIPGRHFTGDLSGTFTTFFSGRLRVGDVVDLITQTVASGVRTLGDNGNWVYRWYSDAHRWIRVVANEAGEVISAFPE